MTSAGDGTSQSNYVLKTLTSYVEEPAGGQGGCESSSTTPRRSQVRRHSWSTEYKWRESQECHGLWPPDDLTGPPAASPSMTPDTVDRVTAPRRTSLVNLPQKTKVTDMNSAALPSRSSSPSLWPSGLQWTTPFTLPREPGRLGCTAYFP